ncbi:MAG: translocation/assembly module TamB [Bacteroides sp.]|nr:translocation/assembly module TamB [Bacteroides sp.]
MRRWLKYTGLIVLSPLLVFLILFILLYIPPVQNVLKQKVAGYLSTTLSKTVSIEKIRLGFPLNLVVGGVAVTQESDTLLYLGKLDAGVHLIPLFKGEVELEGVTLEEGIINSGDFLEGMEIKGTLGRLHLNSDGIYLKTQIAGINTIEIENTNLSLLLNDTTETEKDSTTTVNWQVHVEKLALKEVAFALDVPLDSLYLTAFVGEGEVKEAKMLLADQRYTVETVRVSRGNASYTTAPDIPAAAGFDPGHISVCDLNLRADSVLYQGMQIEALVSELAFNERSGLAVTSFNGRLYSDDYRLWIPELSLQTTHSQVDLRSRIDWNAFTSGGKGEIEADLRAYIGKQDIFLFAPDLPEDLKKAYPNRNLSVQGLIEGNQQHVDISNLSVQLPGTLELTAFGSVQNIADDNLRSGAVDISGSAINLNFLKAFSGQLADTTFVIPPDIGIAGTVTAQGVHYQADLILREQEGRVAIQAGLDTDTEEYRARIRIDSLQINHFLPHDSLYTLSMVASATGQGFDFTSGESTSQVKARINRLEYTDWNFYGIDINALLSRGMVSGDVISNNNLATFMASGEYNLLTDYTDGKVRLDVANIDFYQLGLIPGEQTCPFAFTASAEAHRDTTRADLSAGDLIFRLRARSTLEELIGRSTEFAKVLTEQIQACYLNHVALRLALPTVVIAVNAGENNPVNRFLAHRGINFDDINLRFGTAPDWGINGRAQVNRLRVNDFQLDTIQFVVRQDTSMMNFYGSVVNGPRNPDYTFKASLNGELRNDDGEMMVEYKNGNGETGILLGLNTTPQDNGILFKLLPENPIVAFHDFHLNEDNYILLGYDQRVTADVDMLDDQGMGLRVHSQPDSTALQNIDVELRQIQLKEISDGFPFLPEFTGILSLEANYVQTTRAMQLSVEVDVDDFTYERQPIGDLMLGATWLPGDNGQHYVNSYLSYEDTEVLMANGTYYSTPSMPGDSIAAIVDLEHFPMKIANVFIPGGVAELSGDMDGELTVNGATANPMINGELALDSVAVSSSLYGVYFRLDNRPLQIIENTVTFTDFAIYSQSNTNPFTVNGEVNFRDIAHATADLTMQASNYEILNAPHTRSSLAYGKAYIDLNATVQGPVDALKMRGNIRVLGTTDATYVLADSPLTVQDRLNDVVTFVSFSDTLSLANAQEEERVDLGGIDLGMTVQIDPAVQLRVDLTADRQSYVEVEGGGDLSLQYTPATDLTLTGRYTLTGGRLNYSLPVVPLKEFQIQEGSYVEWSGDPMDPNINVKASERLRAQVNDGKNNRTVDFDVSVAVKNRLEDMDLVFDLEAPEDAAIQTQLTAMAAEERSKQAITLMATGVYLAGGGSIGGFDVNSAFNNFLNSEISNIAGSILKDANIDFEMANYDGTDGRRTDYNFRYSQRFFNDRVQVVIGGKVSSGNTADTDDAFIDNVSLEYRLDVTGSRYVRLFHNKNYESVLEGEITETGAGMIFRKKVYRLKELFTFRRKKQRS